MEFGFSGAERIPFIILIKPPHLDQVPFLRSSDSEENLNRRKQRQRRLNGIWIFRRGKDPLYYFCQALHLGQVPLFTIQRLRREFEQKEAKVTKTEWNLIFGTGRGDFLII
jgi:hypothetical protein